MRVIVDATVEEPFGWVFFYETDEPLEKGGISAALAGNAPLLVLRETGDVIVLGTAHPLEDYLRPYRRLRNDPLTVGGVVEILVHRA
jgi:hypothetical protein